MTTFTVNDLLTKLMDLPGDQTLEFHTFTNTEIGTIEVSLVRSPCDSVDCVLFTAESQADSGE